MSEASSLFLGLMTGLQASAWMALGKVMNPVTGKIERDLEHAKETIDLLGVLAEKTRGNLHPDEERFLSRILFELRMNYVEVFSAAPAPPPPPSPSTPDAGAGAAE
jgi:hypothetical protein